MGDVGRYAVLLALVAGLWSAAASVAAVRTHRSDLARSAEGGIYAAALALVVAAGALMYALITQDFTLEYVVDYTSRALSVPYRVGAFWAGQGGSLLLWTLITGVLGVVVVRGNRKRDWGISGYAVTGFALLDVVFAALVAFVSSPFTKMITPVTDGQGLNPLLQDPLQIIHPLALYLGYILFTVPFVLVLAGFAAGPRPGPWVRVAERWTLWSWIMLTIGIVLGARWAYAELGWGGYWGWDPVENASLLPWLTGTVVLHSGFTHWRSGQLRKLGLVLSVVTYLLSLFGTFLTRSGIISSVHAFGASNLGPIMGSAILAIMIAAAGLAVWRWSAIGSARDEGRVHGWLGQRLLSGLLIAITAAVLWGTMFPLVHRVLQGSQIAVTPGFFRLVVTPLGVAFLGVFAVSPLLPGQQVGNVRRAIVLRGAVFVAAFTGVLAWTRFHNPGIALVVTLGLLSLVTVAQKSARRLRAVWTANSGKSRLLAVSRTSGPYIAHVGLVLLLAAVSLNNSFQTQDRVTLNVGQQSQVGSYNISLAGLSTQQLTDRQRFLATLRLLDSNNSPVATIVTEQDVFVSSGEPHAQVGILTGYVKDVYVVLESADLKTNVATVTVFTNPAVLWIWIGGFLLALGGLLAGLPRRRPRVLDHVPVERELIGVG